MVAAIRQTIKVEQEGRIEIRSSELHSGTTAEVIVLVNSANGRSPLSILDDLQRSFGLSAASAEVWAQEVRTERMSNTRNPVAKAE
jgi:hypothetical protein